MRISDWSSDVCSSDLHRKAAEGFLFLPFDLLLRRGTATPGNESRDTDDDPASQGQLRIFRACQRKGSAEARGDGVYRHCGRNNQEQENHGRQDIIPSKARAIKRSAEQTSELQSLMRTSYAVFCLKKKTHTQNSH